MTNIFDIERNVGGSNLSIGVEGKCRLNHRQHLVLVRLLDDPSLVDVLIRKLLLDLLLDESVHIERVDVLLDQRPHGVDEGGVVKTLEGAAAGGRVNERRPVGLDPLVCLCKKSCLERVLGGVSQGDIVFLQRRLDLLIDLGETRLHFLLDLGDDLILGAVGIGELRGDLVEAVVISLLDVLADVETQIVLIALVLVLEQTVAVELRRHDELIVVGVSVGLRLDVRVGSGSEVDLQVDIEGEIIRVGGALRLHLLVDLLGDGSAKLLDDLGLGGGERGAVCADLNGGVGLAVEHNVHIAADIVALAVVEVRPQALALGLELIDDLRLDLLQGLVGEHDAGLGLDSVLNAGQETVDIVRSGLARGAGDDRVGELVRLLDGGDDLAVLDLESDVPGDLALGLVVAGGKVCLHVLNLDHVVDNVLDLLELRVRQVLVVLVDLINGVDNSLLHGVESVVHLLDGLENGIADQVLGNDHGRFRLPDGVQGDNGIGSGQRDGAAGGVCRGRGASVSRPAQEGVTVAGGGSGHGEAVSGARRRHGDGRRTVQRAAVGVKIQGIGVGSHRGVHRGIHRRRHSAAGNARGVIRLRALHEVRQTVNHRCHLRTGRQIVRAERAVLKAVDQAVTLALLDRGERIRGDRALVDHNGDGAGLGQSHLPGLAIEVEVTLDHGAHLRAGDGIVRGELAVAHAVYDLVGSRPVDGRGVPFTGSHINESALAAVALRTVETEQDRDEHRTGHVLRGGEGLVRDAVEVTLRRHKVYEFVVPVGSADVREIVSFFRQRCGHQGKDDAQCQQSTQDTLLFHLLNHSFFLLMIFEYRKRVSAFPPQALLAASKTCPCPGVRIDARTDSNTVYIKSIRYFLFLQAVLAFFSISFQGSYIRK